jgi:hypothetical protein
MARTFPGLSCTRKKNFMETKEPFMDKASADLFAAIVAQNVADLAHTTNAIEGYLRDELRDWKQRYVALFEKVDDEASKVTTRRLENVLNHHAHWVDFARESLEKGE